MRVGSTNAVENRAIAAVGVAVSQGSWFARIPALIDAAGPRVSRCCCAFYETVELVSGSSGYEDALERQHLGSPVFGRVEERAANGALCEVIDHRCVLVDRFELQKC